LFLFVINFLAKVHQCSPTKIQVFEYLPHEPKQLTAVILRPANCTITTADNYTYCLRASFKTWNFNSVVAGSNFMLRVFANGNGDLQNWKTMHLFSWKNFLQVSYNSWNSYCVVYQSPNIALSINGVQIYSFTEMKQNGEPQLLASSIILGSCLFTGGFSDFNMWKRALSQPEIEQYSLGCDSDFVEKSKPEIIWSNETFTINGYGNAYMTNVAADTFCQQNIKPKNKTQLTHFPKSYRYDVHLNHCKNINGEMFYPRNEANLQLLRSTFSSSFLEYKCKGKFWVPFVRSLKNDNKWIHDGKSSQVEANSFNTWMKDSFKESSPPKHCLYFNIETQKFFDEDCSSESYCSFCEIEERRLLFQLQIDCDFEGKIDSRYFLVQTYAGFYFSGVSGLSNIYPNDLYDEWLLEYVGVANASLRVAASFMSLDPFGIDYWTLNQTTCTNNYMIQMKLSNVSGKRTYITYN
jgi:hypothetical protein